MQLSRKKNQFGSAKKASSSNLFHPFLGIQQKEYDISGITFDLSPTKAHHHLRPTQKHFLSVKNGSVASLRNRMTKRRYIGSNISIRRLDFCVCGEAASRGDNVMYLFLPFVYFPVFHSLPLSVCLSLSRSFVIPFWAYALCRTHTHTSMQTINDHFREG